MLLVCPHCQTHLNCAGLTGVVACSNCQQQFSMPPQPAPQTAFPRAISIAAQPTSQVADPFGIDTTTRPETTTTEAPTRGHSPGVNLALKGLAFVLCAPVGVTIGVVLKMMLFKNAPGALPGGIAVFCCYISFVTLKGLFGVRD